MRSASDGGVASPEIVSSSIVCAPPLPPVDVRVAVCGTSGEGWCEAVKAGREGVDAEMETCVAGVDKAGWANGE